MHVVGHGSGVGYRVEALSNHQSTDRRRCIPTGVLVPGPASNEESVRDEIADTSREPRRHFHFRSSWLVDKSGPWGSAAPAPFLRPVLSSPYRVGTPYLCGRGFESFRACRIVLRTPYSALTCRWTLRTCGVCEVLRSSYALQTVLIPTTASGGRLAERHLSQMSKSFKREIRNLSARDKQASLSRARQPTCGH